MPIPLPADDGPLDLVHLRRTTLGDAALEREVLGMFSRQAAGIIGALAALPPETGVLTHTLKGSARAIGAVRVADRAAGLEAAIRDGGDVAQALDALDAAVAEACTMIELMLSKP
jgi:HPt (histidine-containing phosphotransfer) domain-containing protein